MALSQVGTWISGHETLVGSAVGSAITVLGAAWVAMMATRRDQQGLLAVIRMELRSLLFAVHEFEAAVLGENPVDDTREQLPRIVSRIEDFLEVVARMEPHLPKLRHIQVEALHLLKLYFSAQQAVLVAQLQSPLPGQKKLESLRLYMPIQGASERVAAFDSGALMNARRPRWLWKHVLLWEERCWRKRRLRAIGHAGS